MLCIFRNSDPLSPLWQCIIYKNKISCLHLIQSIPPTLNFTHSNCQLMSYCCLNPMKWEDYWFKSLYLKRSLLYLVEDHTPAPTDSICQWRQHLDNDLLFDHCKYVNIEPSYIFFISHSYPLHILSNTTLSYLIANQEESISRFTLKQ